MACCIPIIVAFAGVAFTNVTFGAQYGEVPKVTIYYLDGESGTFYSINGVPGVNMKVVGNTLEIDHGGINTGQIRVE